MVENPQGALVKRFELAKAAVEADVVVSLPKLKTHQLMYYTGAMKNLFGCVSGLQKAAYHFRYPDRKDFGAMITDLCMALKPAFSLMDAVVAMEGKGPGNGDPYALGLVLASSDILALDWAASSIIGYNPAHIPNQADALARGPWLRDPAKLTIDGPSIKELAVHNFKKVHETGDIGLVRRILPAWMYRYVQNVLTPRPFFRDDLCLRCGECITLCPAKVLSFVPARANTWLRPGSPSGLTAEKAAKRISIDYSACLRCYCCHEVCPADAITLRRG
jgi:formate hydrogenlyase subunit 6/NADH:ubiquinone oxidoreductase subunit I